MCFWWCLRCLRWWHFLLFLCFVILFHDEYNSCYTVHCLHLCRKSPPLHVATARMTISPSSTAGQQPFVRRIVERRTVHSGAVRDRRVPSDAPLPLATQEDSAVINRHQRVSFFNRLTSKFTKKYWLLHTARQLDVCVMSSYVPALCIARIVRKAFWTS